MKRRAVTLAIVAACIALGGCGVPGQNTSTQLDDNDVRVPAPATTTSLPRGTPTRHVELCLISDRHLTAILAELPTPLSVTATLKALVNAPRSALPAGTRSALNDANVVSAKSTTKGTANIDLKGDFSQISPADQLFAIAQIVCTLTSLPGIGQVHFTEQGHSVDIPRADSSLTSNSVSRDDYKPLLPGS